MKTLFSLCLFVVVLISLAQPARASVFHKAARVATAPAHATVAVAKAAYNVSPRKVVSLTAGGIEDLAANIAALADYIKSNPKCAAVVAAAVVTTWQVTKRYGTQ